MSVKDKIRKIISERVFIGDGAIGTLLQQRGLKPGMAPEQMLLDCPEKVEAVHRLYVEAGADMVTTNSFGGSRSKLSQHGLESKLEEINRRAVEVARAAAGDKVFVAASIGPTGELLAPMGSMQPQKMLEIFREQVRVLRDAGADFAMIETMGDIGELQIAARACFLENLPFMASMTFDLDGRSLSGSTAEVTAITLEPFDPVAIGTNCGMGPTEMLSRVKEYCNATSCMVFAQPNAGLPELIDGETVFRLGAEQFAESAVALVNAGAAMVGGCCGTTPEHIKALRQAVQGSVVETRPDTPHVRFSARSGTAIAGYGLPYCIIGERINPTGRRKLSKQLLENDFSQVRKDAEIQVKRGAHILDINMGVPDASEPELMTRGIQTIQGMLPGIPISVDSNDPETLVTGLQQVVGRPLVNSVNGEADRMERLLPVIRDAGANFIALAMDESGIPADAAQRMKIIRRIVENAEKHGISRNRILVDCLVFTVGSQPRQAAETLKAVQQVRDELGCCTILGVSNVSFGLPRRAVISSSFLAMALQSGLTAGIINPQSDRMMETLRSTELLLNRDPGAKKYVALLKEIDEKQARVEAKQDLTKPAGTRKGKPESPQIVKTTARNESTNAIQKTVIDGDKETIISEIDKLLDKKMTPKSILSEYLVPAIEIVGKKYGSGEIYLPQLIMAGETMRKGVDYLRPMLKALSGTELHETPVVIGTVKGDIHDIGKNIVSIVLENHGFKVIDLGKDVDTEDFIKAVVDHKAPLVALSALMTTTMPAMEETVKALHASGKNIKVMVGGAVVTREFSRRIGADGYAKEAVEAGDLARSLSNQE